MEKPVEIKAKYMTLESYNLPKIPAYIAPTPPPENMDPRKIVRSRFIQLIETKYDMWLVTIHQIQVLNNGFCSLIAVLSKNVLTHIQIIFGLDFLYLKH